MSFPDKSLQYADGGTAFTFGTDGQEHFQPRGDRPVYCSDCFRKVRPNK